MVILGLGEETMKLDNHKVMQPNCGFIIIDWDKHTEKVCGNPATAVYVSDDSRKELTAMCLHHASEALVEGDGPVFSLVPMVPFKGE